MIGGGNFVATAIGLNQPTLKASGKAIATVTGQNGKQVAVTFDGFIFDGSTANDGFKLAGDSNVADYATTTVTLLRSTVKGTPMATIPGVSASANCTLQMDQDVVSGNIGGGISLAATDFNITNTLISGNGNTMSTFGGVEVTSTGESGKMAVVNATIVNNSAKTTGIALPSGIYCSSTAVSILNTAVFGNSGQQLDGTDCMTTSFSAYPGASGNNINIGSCMATDLFSGAAPTPFMPVKRVGTCNLVDVGTNIGAPTHDLLGTPRPQPVGGTDDIGCYELQ